MCQGISSATDQGPRSCQEDRLVVRNVQIDYHSGILIAIADGHGGYETSSYVTDELSAGLFDKMLAEFKNVNDSLKKMFQYLNNATLELSRRNSTHSETGTTLSVVYLPNREDKCYVAIIGDSPVILARR